MLKNACKHHSNFQVFQTQDEMQSDSIISNSVKTKDDWMLKVLYILIPVFFWGGGYLTFPIYEALTPNMEDIEAEIGSFCWGDLMQHHSDNPFWGFVINEFLQILHRLKPCNLSNPRPSLLQTLRLGSPGMVVSWRRMPYCEVGVPRIENQSPAQWKNFRCLGCFSGIIL